MVQFAGRRPFSRVHTNNILGINKFSVPKWAAYSLGGGGVDKRQEMDTGEHLRFPRSSFSSSSPSSLSCYMHRQKGISRVDLFDVEFLSAILHIDLIFNSGS